MSASGSNTLDQYVQQHHVRNTEILWTLKSGMSKVLFHSCEQLKYLFPAMFSDSKITESFQFGKTKCGCYVIYDIAPIVESQILKV